MPTQIVKITQLPLSVTLSDPLPVSFTGGTLDLGDLNGAATAAKQPGIGTAGAESLDVLTVQGSASMTPFKVNGSGYTQPVSGTFYQTTQPVSQSGTWTVALSTTLGDMLAYTPSGAETGMVVRPLPNRNDLMLVRQMQVIADEIRLLRRVFQDWSGAGEPRHPFTDNVNIVQ